MPAPRPPSPPRLRAAAVWLLTVLGTLTIPAGELRRTLPSREVLSPDPAAVIEISALNESSGIVASRRHPGVYWTHNDSGDAPRLFAIRADGRSAQSAGPASAGIPVTGARAVDWEDICLDDQGQLVIADLGNNSHRRQDLALYFVPEPDPARDEVTAPARMVRVRYPDQKKPSGARKIPDCEALFWADGRAHVLTKDRKEGRAQLYRLDALPSDPAGVADLTALGALDLDGPVTAADASPDGRRLVLLTYEGLWLLERPEAAADFSTAKTFWRPLRAFQCEAVCLDGPDHVLVTNEQRRLYRIALAELPPLP